jgi:hypothetical protein
MPSRRCGGSACGRNFVTVILPHDIVQQSSKAQNVQTVQ